MKGNLTFSMVKPTAVKNNHIGHILNMVTDAGFYIRAIKMVKLTKEEAERFYEVHKGKEFFGGLVEFMTSGPVVALVLEKENAVEDYRKLMGSTDPSQAADGTIRKLYATSKTMNAVHGSDSDENAQIEMRFFFSQMEIFRPV